MRSTTTVKFLAAAYALGLIWTVALVGGTLVLTQPMLELYAVLGIESAAIETTATMSLVVVIATAVAVAAGFVVRAAAGHTSAGFRAEPTPEAAVSHRV
ncbi:MAG: hypothetical protein AB1Z66_14850 [Candidatus Limnocylindrales bacterium]